MYKSCSLVLLAFVFSFVSCQSINDIDVDDGLKKLQEQIPDLESFNKTHLPKVEDVEKVLRDKCKSAGAANAVDDLKKQGELAKACIEKQVNVTNLQEELEVAKSTGSMDEVFAKYCKKWPEMYACLEDATSTARQCMNKKEEEAFNRTLVIASDLQEFVCFKDGDRLAMFVAEGGVDCIQSKKDELQACVNTTLGDRMPDPDDLSITSLPTFLYSAEDCEDFNTIRICVNSVLESCKDSTPANIVDAFFRFLKKQMPCKDGPSLKQSNSETGASTGGSSVFASSLVLICLAALSRTMW